MSKKTIAVFCLPLYGHVNPLSRLIEALVSDYRVIVYSAEGGESEYTRTIFTEMGAEYKTFGNYATRFNPDIGKDALKAAELILDVAENEMQKYFEEIKNDKPDIVIHDSYAFWAKITAKRLGVPAVSVSTTFVLSTRLIASYPLLALEESLRLLRNLPRVLSLQSRYSALNKKYDLKSPKFIEMFSNRGVLNIAFTSREFQPHGGTFDSSYLFIGPSIHGKSEEEKMEQYTFPAKQPLVYISLGTIFNADNEFFEMCIKAFRSKPFNVLISAGNNKNVHISDLPSNIQMQSFVHQISVLKQASLFITHAGMNSVSESLYFAVPMVLIPMIQEQKINAARVAEVGAGTLLIRKGLTAEKLATAVEEVISKSKYRKATNYISKTLHDAGGISVAAAAIRALLK